MAETLDSIILSSTGARSAVDTGKLQDLWSGYGRIARYWLEGAGVDSVVVKHVRYPPGKTTGRKAGKGRRGGRDLSHERKAKSYRVETAWYRDWSERCGDGCRVPRCFGLGKTGDDTVMVLEDLDAAGYSERRSSASWEQMQPCLEWLAEFHATFMGAKPSGLWRSGTYWHLQTRPDELKALDDRPLADAAADIDRALRASPYQTLVHGDAKLANFCFTRGGREVAAVDFQYVGGGCGMKDLAYFVGSCLYEDQCEREEGRILDAYFRHLRGALARRTDESEPGPAPNDADPNDVGPLDVDALEADWRALYPVAWADFHRFYKGWSPGRWRADSYSERVARRVIAALSAAEGDSA